MKREIKFRAWDKHKKVFIPNDVYAIINRTDFDAFGIMIKDWENYKEGEFFYDDAQELVQFTGLLDRRGKEIYEGDICKIYFDVDKVEDYIYNTLTKNEVATGTKVFVVESPLFNNQEEFTADTIEVIGNIYENPELLSK